MLPSLDDNVILGYSRWQRVEVGLSAGYRQGEAFFTMGNLKIVFPNVDGFGFTESVLAFFDQRRIYNNNGPQLGAKCVTSEPMSSSSGVVSI